MNGPSEADMSAAAHLVENAGHWLETRLGVDAPTARFAAKHVSEIMWPYVHLAAFSNLADAMRDGGHDEIALAIEEIRDQYLKQLAQLKEDGWTTKPTND